MLTPDGHSAKKIEKVMLLSLWANHLKEELSHKKMIFAGLGRPTYPINSHTIKSYLSYWLRLDELSTQWHLNPELVDDAAIDYGDPRGDKEPRTLMAGIMSEWYGVEVKAEHILFTVGGIGGLRAIFDTLNTHFEDSPGYRIITPFPHYSVYSNNNVHQLHPIPVMDTPGYKLTAKVMHESIQEAYRLAETDHGWPKAILICNPSNPLGTIIDKEELLKIAAVLREYPELYIILDEAYAELSFSAMPSFLNSAPDLKNRTIILRSATKALSAAGERMAILLVFDSGLMNELLNKNINYFIHAPRSAQLAYAETMAQFDVQEQKKLAHFYAQKVAYVAQRLQQMGANMPDPLYTVEATFYVLGDFSDLFALELPIEATRVLQKMGPVTTDEDLAYYLLFMERVMIAPLSYFGLAKNSGFMRITCSAPQAELKELMDRLESLLSTTRQMKKNQVLAQINQALSQLSAKDQRTYERIIAKITELNYEEKNCLVLKKHLTILNQSQTLVDDFLLFLN